MPGIAIGDDGLAQSGVRYCFAFLDVEHLHLRMQKQPRPCSEPKSTTCEPIKISFHLHVFARIDPSSECFPYSALQG